MTKMEKERFRLKEKRCPSCLIREREAMPSFAAKLNRPAAVLAAILLSLSPLSAQRAHFGASAGISFAFFNGPEDLFHQKNEQLAYRAGISIGYDLSQRFSIVSGLEFWNKSFEGSLRSYGMLTVITPIHLRVQHLALPLMLRYHMGRSLYFGAGAYFAQKISGRLNFFRDENERLKSAEFGYVLGVGTAFRLLQREHAFEIQWRQGLTPVFAIDEDKFYFSTLSVLYGLRF
jgi:Outer membrane protein beta-barrel domain